MSAAAGNNRFEAALAEPVVLSESDDQRLHDEGRGDCRGGELSIERVGAGDAAFDDRGIEYDRYPPARSRCGASGPRPAS